MDKFQTNEGELTCLIVMTTYDIAISVARSTTLQYLSVSVISLYRKHGETCAKFAPTFTIQLKIPATDASGNKERNF